MLKIQYLDPHSVELKEGYVDPTAIVFIDVRDRRICLSNGGSVEGISRDDFDKLIEAANQKEYTAKEFYKNASYFEKSEFKKMMDADNIKEDAYQWADDNDKEMTDEIAGEIARLYVYENKTEANISHWENISNLYDLAVKGKE